MDNFQSEVLQRLTRIESRLNNGLSKTQEDHEKRIRILERGFWIAIGSLMLIEIIFRVFLK